MKCSRCNAIFKGWEDSVNEGTIDLRLSSRSFDRLGGGKYGSGDLIYDQMRPPLQKCLWQQILLKWDRGGKYRLCSKCQDGLASVIGEFFGYAPRGKMLIERRKYILSLSLHGQDYAEKYESIARRGGKVRRRLHNGQTSDLPLERRSPAEPMNNEQPNEEEPC